MMRNKSVAHALALSATLRHMIVMALSSRTNVNMKVMTHPQYGLDHLRLENEQLRRKLALLESSEKESTLYYHDDRWKLMKDKNEIDQMPAFAERSKASIEVEKNADSQKWLVKSPIAFEYMVLEEPNLFEFGVSDTLIFGHLLTPDARAQDESNYARSGERRRLIFVDQTVYNIHGDRIEAFFQAATQAKVLSDYHIHIIDAKETKKDMNLVIEIATAIKDFDLQRKSPVIAIGGGVALDAVGLAATLYRRKTPYVRIPTTLLSYVDASVGAKTGVNFMGHKNRLGAYVPPAATFLSSEFLVSEERRATISGVAEIMKMALVKSPQLFLLLEQYGSTLLDHKFSAANVTSQEKDALDQTLRLAIETMLEELAPNLWEDRLNRLVDFGHVFGLELEMRALNKHSDHDNPPITHGESVAVDMAFSTILARRKGLISYEKQNRILACMRSCGLPTYHPKLDKNLLSAAYHERILHALKLRLPLPTDIGISHIFNDVTLDDILDAHDGYTSTCALDSYPYFDA